MPQQTVVITGASSGIGFQVAFHFAGRAARVVLACRNMDKMGSIAHRFGALNLSDLNWETTKYDQWKAYANSKVALLNHTLELNRRLQANASQVIALAAHPGLANTNIKQAHEALHPPGPVGRWYAHGMAKLIPTAASGARSVILAATADHVTGGEYYGPGGLFELGGTPKLARLHPIARDAELSGKLWHLTETLTGSSYLSEAQRSLRAATPQILRA